MKNTPEIRFKGFTDAWVQRRLGEVADIVRGASPRPIQDPKWFDDNSDIGWLRISDVTEQNGRIYYLDQKISEAGQSKTRVLTEPHLLLSIAATIGRPVINYIKTGVHDGFLIFLNPKFEQEFMFQWFEMFRLQWQQYGQPGSQVNLNSDLVKAQEILLPPSEEQTAIGNLFRTLDNTILLYKRKLDSLKQLKKAYLQQMFPQEGETVPKVRFAGFKGDWEVYTLGELGSTYTGLSGKTKEDFGKGEAKYVTYLNILNNLLTNSEEMGAVEIDNKQNEVKYGDIFFTTSSETPEEVGMSSVWLHTLKNIYLNSFCFGFRPSRKVCPYYMAFMLRSPYVRVKIQLLAQGISRYNISKTKLMEIEINMPSLVEQTAIGNFFRNLDEQITTQQTKLNNLKLLKSAYLQKMFV